MIVFRIPFNFALPGRNRIISHFSHTEHRVGEDMGFGVGELTSLASWKSTVLTPVIFLFTDQSLVFIE